MSFLLHLDTCLACVRRIPRVNTRFQQHQGSLHYSAVTVTGLELWLMRPRTPAKYLQPYGAMMRQVAVLNVDDAIAHRAAVIGSPLQVRGQRMNVVDLLIAATALVHRLTLVTHDTHVFVNVPGLALVDWMVP